MLHEKPNESFHWKNKLDELDQLPGESHPDKSASWQKLHDRLRPKPAQKRTVWYWIAAAVLLAAVLIPMIMSKHTNQPVIVDKPGSKQQSNSSETASKDFLSIDTMTVKKKAITVSVSKKNPKRVAITKVDNILPIKISNDTSLRPSPEIIVQAMKFPDTLTSVFVAAPPKKKLRVVHINELGQPVSEQVQYVKGPSSPVFQSTIHKDNLPAFSLSRNASDNLVKIKLSPSN